MTASRPIRAFPYPPFFFFLQLRRSNLQSVCGRKRECRLSILSERRRRLVGRVGWWRQKAREEVKKQDKHGGLRSRSHMQRSHGSGRLQIAPVADQIYDTGRRRTAAREKGRCTTRNEGKTRREKICGDGSSPVLPNGSRGGFLRPPF